MPRVVSMNARRAFGEQSSDEIEIFLLRVTHPQTGERIRLSSDPTERISLEPLIFGTRSTWLTDDGDPFLFALMSAVLPGDQDDAPPAAQIIVESIDGRVADELRSTTDRALVDIAVVLASSPDQIEVEYRGLYIVGAEGSGGQITLSISMDPITEEPCPTDRMTRQRFPGLFR